MRFNEQAKQGLMKEMGIKTKCGLRRAYFRKNRFWRQERERRPRVEEKSRFWWEIIPISGFQVIKEEGGRRKLGQRVLRDSRYEPKP